MINAVSLLKRKPGLTAAEFQRYWRHEHAGVIANLPGVQRYIQSHPLAENYEGREPVYDGIAELWARDSQAFRDIAASDAYLAVQKDEENFLDRTAIALVLTDERIIKEGPVAADGVKCIRFMSRRSGMPVEEFQAYWHDEYGPLLAALPSLDRYVQYHARLGGYTHGRQPRYDGFDVTWFASNGALCNAKDSTIYEQNRNGQKDFLAVDDCPQILCREYRFIG